MCLTEHTLFVGFFHLNQQPSNCLIYSSSEKIKWMVSYLLKHLTRKIKPSIVIQRFDVSNITIKRSTLRHLAVYILDNDVRNIETTNNVTQFNFSC